MQISRAVGIHIILATSEINAKILGGIALANLINRLTFRTIDSKQSRNAIYSTGAEKLNGKGDFLYLGEMLYRGQGLYIPDSDFAKIFK